MPFPINNFTAIESVYGKFIVNRRDKFQAEALIRTGRPHIDDELAKILGIVHGLPGGAMAVDAGANAGLIAVPMAQMLAAKGGAVLAFEVQRMMYYALCGTAALNDLENLFVYNLGLGDTIREEAIGKPDYAVAQDFGMFSLLEQKGAPRVEQVRIVTVDSLGLPRLDFLKIDVEGMEVELLRGAARTIAAHRPWCWVEFWKVGAEAIKTQFAPVAEYDFFLVDELNMLCAPCEKLAGSGLVMNAPRV